MTLSVQDKLAIHELLSRSAYGFDEAQLDLLEDCFTEDAVFSIRIAGGDLVGPFDGRDAIMGLYRSSIESQTDVRRHVVSNIFFESENDDPVVISNLTLMATENGEIKLLTAGIYRDVVRATQDGWRLLNRHLDLDRPY
jgi:3-phenylpropionate/cinnamic acid dioxygenase small subunit